MKRYKNTPYIILIFYGLFTYAVSNIISMTSFAGYIIKLLAVIFILWTLIQAPKGNKEGRFSKIISLFVYYTVFIIIRGTFLGRVPSDGNREITSLYDIIQNFMWNQFSPLSFIVILAILIPFDPKELRYYRTFTYICTFLCLVGIYRYSDYLFNATMRGETNLYLDGRELTIRNLIAISFVGLGAVVLYAFNYNTFKRSFWDYFPILILVLYFVSYVASGGRGGSINAFLYCVFALYFYSIGTRKRQKKSPFRIVIVLAVLGGAIYGVWYLYVTGYFDFLLFRLFEDGEFGGELNETSREGFIQELINYLNAHPLAWVFGRGVNGYYITSSGTFRPTIETGYWYLILKGGIIYLFLYVYILLKAAYIGFFKSNNQFVKTLGALCLLRVYMLVPFGLPEVSLDFVLAWHSVSLINSDYLRNLTDVEVKALIDGQNNNNNR